MVATVGKITAGAGYGYLTEAVAKDRHDYYTGSGEAAGVWSGSGAHGLGLAGTVDHEVMGWLYGSFVDPRSLGGGIDPATGRPRLIEVLGQELSRPRTINKGTPAEKTLEQIAALDVTFSPSKSVSVLWALASDDVRQQIIDAHEEAVDAGVAYLEANAGHARVGRGGVRRIDTDGLVVAKFRHRTARTTDPERVGDPQIHTHCAILNRVHGADGKWRTLDGKAVFAHAHAAGALYGSRLEELLSERLGVAWVTPEVGERVLMREIVGVPQAVRDRFSTRRDQVLAHYDRLEAEWRARNGRSPSKTERGELIEQAKVRSRLGKVKGDGVDLHARWRAEVTDAEHADVLGALGQVDPADGGRVAPGSDKMTFEVFNALEGQRSWWTRAHLYAEVARRSDVISAEAIELEVERLVGLCVNLEPDPDDQYRQADRTKFTSDRILTAEAGVLRAAHQEPAWTVEAVPEERLGDDQVVAVEALCSGPTRVTTVIGPAGAGKTTMLRSVAASYAQAGRPLTVLTLSAAAARVVSEETGIDAHTIASWEVGQVNLPRQSLILIDEASMVPTLTLDKLVRLADAYQCRIGLVGDYAQMGSPEAGGLLRDLADLDSTVEMIAVRRFSEPWERDTSRQLRARNAAVAATYQEHRRLHGSTADTVVDRTVKAWATDTITGSESIIVVDTSEQAADVSARCQQVLLEHDLIGHEVAVGRNDCRLRVGDLIQSRLNTPDVLNSEGNRILNRDTWTITGIDADRGELLVAHTRNRTTARLPLEYVADHVELAYAVTIAGAQGRTTVTGHVIVTPRTSSSALYVGMTRGRKSNHAHVVTDGHLHDEFGLGLLDTRSAFEAAVTRTGDGELSAHRVRDIWQRSTPERDDTRNADRHHIAAQQRWDQHLTTLPASALTALDGHHHLAIAILTRTDEASWDQQLTAAVVDWSDPAAARQFLHLLGRHDPIEFDTSAAADVDEVGGQHRDNTNDLALAAVAVAVEASPEATVEPADAGQAMGPNARDAQRWWTQRFRSIGQPTIAAAMKGHHRTIITVLSHHQPASWDRLVANTLARTDWNKPTAGTDFAARLRADGPYFDRSTRTSTTDVVDQQRRLER